MNTRALTALLSSLALVAACSSNAPRQNTVSQGPGSVVASGTQYGAVSAIEVVPEASRGPGLGAVAGAVIGGVLGNQIGSGSGRAAATAVGAVGGGVAGHAIQGQRAGTNEVYRVTVRFDNGTTGQFHYSQIGDLRVGDRVRAQDTQLYRL